MKTQLLYFPGLNGLRAIAAMAVVISHTTLSLGEFNLPAMFSQGDDVQPQGLKLASYGVSIFFALSGFLITYLLQAEKEFQPIDIKKFYLRRALRIWPLYYLYIILIAVMLSASGVGIIGRPFFFTVFMAANIPALFGQGIFLIGHYWSLGVEEQFYIVWPWINQKVTRYLKPFILAIIILVVSTKITLHFFFPGSQLEMILHINRFHCMMTGALGAILFKEKNRLFLQLVDNKLSQSVCWLIMLLLLINKFHFASVIDDELISIVALFLIIGQINIRHRILNLELGIFNYLGKISYGIYVIHPLIIYLLSKFIRKNGLPNASKYILVYASVIAGTIAMSHLSYVFFEKYFMNLKKKFVVVGSSASRSGSTPG
jgi:peptidoglycan/LPS O-acetylase OafA/YrhL